MYTCSYSLIVGRLRNTRVHIASHFQSDCTTLKYELNATNSTHVHTYIGDTRDCIRRLRMVVGHRITPRNNPGDCFGGGTSVAATLEPCIHNYNCRGQAEFLASLTKARRNLHSSECVRQSGPREIKENTSVISFSLLLLSSCIQLSVQTYRENTKRMRRTGRKKEKETR